MKNQLHISSGGTDIIQQVTEKLREWTTLESGTMYIVYVQEEKNTFMKLCSLIGPMYSSIMFYAVSPSTNVTQVRYNPSPGYTRSSWAPTISRDFLQNSRLNTGARVHFLLLTIFLVFYLRVTNKRLTYGDATRCVREADSGKTHWGTSACARALMPQWGTNNIDNSTDNLLSKYYIYGSIWILDWPRKFQNYWLKYFSHLVIVS